MEHFPCERFSPMDDELLLYYLEPKMNGKPVPGVGKVIFEEDLYGEEDPWKTWKRHEAERANDLRKTKDLFFITKLKNSSANRVKRTVGSGGTWKGQASGKSVYLLDEKYQKETTTLLGYKKTLTYKNDKSAQDGCWIMYEFELDESRIIKNNNKANKKKDVYVLCLLRKNDDEKKLARKRGHQERVDDVDEEDYPQEKRARAPFEGDQDQFLKPSSSLQAENKTVLPTMTLEEDQAVQGGHGIVGWQDPNYAYSMQVEPEAEAMQEKFLQPYPTIFEEAEKEEAAAVAYKPLGEDWDEFMDVGELLGDESEERNAETELGQWLSFDEADDQQHGEEDNNMQPLDAVLLDAVPFSAGGAGNGGVNLQKMRGGEGNDKQECKKLGDNVVWGNYMSTEDLMKIEEALMKMV